MKMSNAELIAMARQRAEKYSSGSDEYVINLLIATIEQSEAGRDEALVEWGVRFRRDGIIESYTTREKAEARAAGTTRIESADGLGVRELPPTDPKWGRELVSRTTTAWQAAE